MGMLEDIADYIILQGLATAKGSDVFQETLPEAPDTCIAIFEYAGRPPPLEVSTVERNFQVMTRNVDPDLAREKSWSIYKVLHQEESKGDRRDLTAERWGLISATDTPFKLKVDQNGRTVYACNYNMLTQKD